MLGYGLKFEKLALRGQYVDAITRMEEVADGTLRILRHAQYWTAHLGLLKLRRHLHRLVCPCIRDPKLKTI